MPRLSAILAFIVAFLASLPALAREPVDGPFFYRFGEAAPARAEPGDGWTRVERLSDVPKRGGDSLWVVTALPASVARHDALLVPAVYVRFAAYLDGERIGGDESADAGGHAFHLVPLPDEHAGWLSLHVTSDYTKTGFRGDMFIGSEAEHVSALVRRDAGRAVLVVIFLLIALGSLVFGVRGEVRSAYLGLAVWSMCAAVWTGFYTAIREVLLPEPRFWITAWGISLAGLGPSLLLYLRAVLGGDGSKSARVITALFWVNTVSSAVGVTILLTGASTAVSNPFLYVHRTLIGITAIAIVVLLAVRVRANEDARTLAAGMVVYMLLSIRDVLVSVGAISEARVVTPWGILVLIGCAAWVLRRRVVRLRARALALAEEVVVHAREREMMLRDMHDGLGRITTSISMLTEVARRDRASDKPLDAIFALAREGSDEIRTFMRGLDAEADDWPSMLALLRDRASALVDALGGSYRLEADMADGVPAPSPYLLVHLLRVFQEGLTNALKHADEPSVVAVLAVDGEGVTLTLTNDGVRAVARKAGTGIGLGAGLANMRARARELGGALTLTHDPDLATMELVLRIPLPLAYDGVAHVEPARSATHRDRRG